MNGFLDFLKTPAGQAILATGLGAAASAGRGRGLLGNIGQGGLMGLQAYGGAQEQEYLNAERKKSGELRDMQLSKARRQDEFMQNLPAPTNPNQQMLADAARAGALPLADYLKATQPKQVEFGKIEPKDYTQESLREAMQTGDYTRLVPVRKMDVVNNQAVNLYNTKPGQVFDTFDPNKPFNLQGGQLAPNKAYQNYEMGKARAGATNVSVNTEKSLLNELAGGLGKGITDAKGGAQAALSTIGTVNRLMDALDSGQVMAGPGTTFRQTGLQIGNMLGVAGQNSQEKLLNTRQAIQSLAQLELDAAQQMKGQGQITEAERAIIRRAASGDIDGMTVPELRVLGGILDRTARTKIRSFNQQAQPLVSNLNAAPLAPFLTVEEPPERKSQGGVRRFNPATGKIE